MEQTKNHIDYVEFKAADLAAIKKFYSSVFGWNFTDYGPTYIAFDNSGLTGGFELCEDPVVNGTLIVLYHDDLEKCMSKIKENGGIISRSIFSFPGGKRFHFNDPSGNELAVWSEK